jgi:hypothetical protein
VHYVYRTLKGQFVAAVVAKTSEPVKQGVQGVDTSYNCVFGGGG